MKNILILAIFLSVASCGKCPECFNISAPIRIIYLNESGENLLSNGTVEPKRISLRHSNVDIPFGIKDYVVSGSKEKFHMELANEQIHEECLNNVCVIIIEFENNLSNDTLTYSILESKSDCCTTYNVVEFKYNGDSYLGMEENTLGAYEILK